MSRLLNTASTERICALLESAHGRPECDPDYGPLDELVLTILSQHTSAVNYNKAFENLKQRFVSWEEVGQADLREIENAIRPGGLAPTKAVRIRRLLQDIRAEYGVLSLDFLAEMADEDARAYLMQFDGVGIKTASCVLMFSLCRPVLPVDTHVHRITQRLGLIDSSVSAEEAHHLLPETLPDELVYSFHVNLVRHGRKVCKARNPLCDDCVLLELCGWGQRMIR